MTTRGFAAVALLVLQVPAAAQYVWTQLGGVAPSNRALHAMVWTPARRRASFCSVAPPTRRWATRGNSSPALGPHWHHRKARCLGFVTRSRTNFARHMVHVSAAKALPATATTTTPGSGMGSPGPCKVPPSARALGWHMRWPTTLRGNVWCCSAAGTAAPCRRIPGDGTAPAGHKWLQSPARLRGTGTGWPTTQQGRGSFCSAAGAGSPSLRIRRGVGTAPAGRLCSHSTTPGTDSRLPGVPMLRGREW